MRARIKPYVTDWHALLFLILTALGIFYAAAYKYLNPSDFQLQNALYYGAIAVLGWIVYQHQQISHKSELANIKQELAIIEQRLMPPEPAQPTGPVPAFDPLANRQPPYTHD